LLSDICSLRRMRSDTCEWARDCPARSKCYVVDNSGRKECRGDVFYLFTVPEEGAHFKMNPMVVGCMGALFCLGCFLCWISFQQYQNKKKRSTSTNNIAIRFLLRAFFFNMTLTTCMAIKFLVSLGLGRLYLMEVYVASFLLSIVGIMSWTEGVKLALVWLRAASSTRRNVTAFQKNASKYAKGGAFFYLLITSLVYFFTGDVALSYSPMMLLQANAAFVFRKGSIRLYSRSQSQIQRYTLRVKKTGNIIFASAILQVLLISIIVSFGNKWTAYLWPTRTFTFWTGKLSYALLMLQSWTVGNFVAKGDNPNMRHFCMKRILKQLSRALSPPSSAQENANSTSAGPFSQIPRNDVHFNFNRRKSSKIVPSTSQPYLNNCQRHLLQRSSGSVFSEDTYQNRTQSKTVHSRDLTIQEASLVMGTKGTFSPPKDVPNGSLQCHDSPSCL